MPTFLFMNKCAIVLILLAITAEAIHHQISLRPDSLQSIPSKHTTQIQHANPDINYGNTSLNPTPQFLYSVDCYTRNIAPKICTLNRHQCIGTRYETIQPCLPTKHIQLSTAEQPCTHEIAAHDALMHTEPWKGHSRSGQRKEHI